MMEQGAKSAVKGFCTFCMGTYDSSRMGNHVARCSARRDDAGCVDTGGKGIEMPPPENLSDKQITAKLWEVVRALEKLRCISPRPII